MSMFATAVTAAAGTAVSAATVWAASRVSQAVADLTNQVEENRERSEANSEAIMMILDQHDRLKVDTDEIGRSLEVGEQ